MKFLKVALLFNLALMASIAHAFVIPDVGSTLVIDKAETMYVNDGDVFDLSSFNLQADGILDIYSNTPNATFSIIASNAITLSGLLNVYLSNLFFVSDSFYLSGTLAVNGNSVSLNAPYMNITGTIDLRGNGDANAPTYPYTGSSGAVVTIPGFPDVPRVPVISISGNNTNMMPIYQPWITATNVPEAQRYGMLLAGLGLVCLAVNRRST